jgi:glycerol-3-phosphate dehydrogenase (NAD(P)+)
MLGLQICGALKNCIALLIGMLDGARYSESTQAAVLTYAFKELKYAVGALGGNEETVDSFAGIGDLVLTAYGKSRNRTVGHRLGAGEKLDAILASMHAVPESVTTLKAIQHLSIQKNIILPLFKEIYKVVFENAPLNQFLKIILPHYN